MIFLNVALLIGATAAAVPLIIHLLHRTRIRVVHWGAMQFLAGAIEKKSRRLQWQQWLLLAIRCSIPALLALAMAQPALTWVSDRLGAGATSRPLVLIDNSYSMLAGFESEEDAARTIANTVAASVSVPRLVTSDGSQMPLLADTPSAN